MNLNETKVKVLSAINGILLIQSHIFNVEPK